MLNSLAASAWRWTCRAPLVLVVFSIAILLTPNPAAPCNSWGWPGGCGFGMTYCGIEWVVDDWWCDFNCGIEPGCTPGSGSAVCQTGTVYTKCRMLGISCQRYYESGEAFERCAPLDL